jgi:hypothetical protein
VWIYRFPEPKQLRDATVTATQYDVKYAEGARDAEALMVHPKTGRVYIASKKQDGGGALFAGPERLSTSGTNVFRKVAPIDVWVTDGAFSPDGTRLVMRSYFGARMYRWQNGKPKDDIGSVGVPIQQQGESVTFTPDGRTLMYGSEGRDSQVKPVGLSDDQLPESAKGDGADSGANGEKGKGGSDLDPNLVKGGLAVIAVTVLVVALRRLFRRR